MRTLPLAPVPPPTALAASPSSFYSLNRCRHAPGRGGSSLVLLAAVPGDGRIIGPLWQIDLPRRPAALSSSSFYVSLAFFSAHFLSFPLLCVSMSFYRLRPVPDPHALG